MEIRENDLAPAGEQDGAPRPFERRSRLRPRSEEEQSVSFVELFFDLVYALNVRGELPGVLADAGMRAVAVRDRMRTPTGTYEIVTGAHPAAR